MRACLVIFAVVCSAVLLATDSNVAGEKKKEVVLKGLVACTKCELAKSTTCETIIIVTDAKKKDTIYIFDKDSHAKYHDDICAAAKKGTVTGIVKDVDKKKVISVKKVEYD